jgi:hypothetical protein
MLLVGVLARTFRASPVHTDNPSGNPHASPGSAGSRHAGIVRASGKREHPLPRPSLRVASSGISVKLDQPAPPVRFRLTHDAAETMSFHAVLSSMPSRGLPNRSAAHRLACAILVPYGEDTDRHLSLTLARGVPVFCRVSSTIGRTGGFFEMA